MGWKWKSYPPWPSSEKIWDIRSHELEVVNKVLMGQYVSQHIDIFFILASDDSFSDENIELTIISKWKAELLLKNL